MSEGPCRILVLPRSKAERLNLDTTYAVISISDPPPHSGPANIKQRWGLLDVLRLEFHDFDADRWPPEMLDTVTDGKTLSEWCMNDAQAEQVARFVHKVAPIVRCLVIHCEAGASRSPSMAMAIQKHYLTDWIIDWPEHSLSERAPNVGVFNRTANALERMRAMGVVS